ncbi:major facilitator superfamily domain-containing protein [Russula dissimulans]|nr:major facilitator superfamily domain-containing protein [Russula dissimulans]
MAARIGLGFFEAGFGPGIPLYFSLFYTKHELGLRLAYWFGFAAVAGAFGGLIAYGVQHAHAAIANWRLLFIIEGIPAILLGLIAIAFLPDRPETTGFFTEEERKIALARANRDTSGDIGYHINKSHIADAFKDWKIYLGGVIYFGANAALASISAFLPTIIKTFGYTNALAQLLTVPPYAVTSIVITIASWSSDRLLTRGPFIVIASAIGGIGYVLLLTAAHNDHVRYFATFCIVSGTYTTIGLTIAWYAHNLGSESKRATGTPLYMAIGQCGSVLGSHLFPAIEGPRYIKGFSGKWLLRRWGANRLPRCASFMCILTPFVLVLAGLLFLGSMCTGALTSHFRYENARRDRVFGKHIPNTRVDTSELADRRSHVHTEISSDRPLVSATLLEPGSDEEKKHQKTRKTSPSCPSTLAWLLRLMCSDSITRGSQLYIPHY